MGRVNTLRKTLKKLDGFFFGKEPIDLSDDVYYALVEFDRSIANYSIEMVVSNVLNRLTTLFKTSIPNENVYRRVGGGIGGSTIVTNACKRPVLPRACQLWHDC
ncbi:hypothetical protein DL770_002002 [Monosporascus sp. CRB-9-2]|nr:hypothetical protein DL770_002002 [Monosporascus sp. CRB-9-2]